MRVAPPVGDGPVVIVVHGVGVGPSAFGPLAGRLTRAGYRVALVHRPGYGLATGDPFTTLADQVDDLVGVVDRLGRSAPGVALVGVSGGATLALLVAVERARAGAPAVPVVAHEPLVGPLAPALHRRVARSVADLGHGAGRFVRQLVGDATWSLLDDAARATVIHRPALVADEARAFARLSPTPDDLTAVRRAGQLVTTVGDRSGPERHLAAGVLASLAGARVAVVGGAGHLAHVEAPDAFAATVVAALATDASDTSDTSGTTPLGAAAAAGARR